MEKVDVDDYFVAIKGRQPSGLKAETSRWAFELYENKKDKSWVVIGRDKTHPKKEDELCVLDVGDDSYYNRSWYKNLIAKTRKQ